MKGGAPAACAKHVAEEQERGLRVTRTGDTWYALEGRHSPAPAPAGALPSNERRLAHGDDRGRHGHAIAPQPPTRTEELSSLAVRWYEPTAREVRLQYEVCQGRPPLLQASRGGVG